MLIFRTVTQQAKISAGLLVDMEESLKEIAQHGLIPDQVTYQRFVENFCENGQTDRALKLVSEMVQGQRSRGINHALIKCHLKSRSPQRAHEVLLQMKLRGIEPDSETYTVLACGLAECGKPAEVLRAIDTMELSPQQLLRIVQSTSDLDLIEKLCARISKLHWSISQVEKCCVELLYARKLNEARSVVDHLIKSSSATKKADLSFFSRQMVRSEYSANDVMDFVRSIDDREERRAVLMTAVETAYLESDTPLGLIYLSEFRGDAFRPKEHYFYPLICRAASEIEVYAVLKRMFSWQIPPGVTAMGFAFWKLVGVFNIGVLTAMLRLKFLHVPEDTMKQAVALYYVSYRGIPYCFHVLDLLDRTALDYLVPLIAEHTTLKTRYASVLLIEKISKKLGRDPAEMKQEYERHLSDGIFPDASTNLGSSIVLTYSQPPNTWSTRRKRNSQAELSVLTHACASDDPDLVRAQLRTLDEDDLGRSSLCSLVNFYCRVKDPERVMHYFNRLRAIPDVEIGDWMVFSVMIMLINCGKFDEAYTIAKEYEFRGNFKSFASKSSKFMDLCERSLEHCGLEATLKILEVLLPKFLPIESPAFHNLMRHIIQHAPERVLEIFVRLNESFGITPGLVPVYRHFISLGKEEDLRTTYDCSRRKLRPETADLFLAFAFILERRLPQAKSLLKYVPRDDTRLLILRSLCENLFKMNQVSDLELLLEYLTECNFGYEPLYLMLATAYGKTRDVEKVDRLWLHSQEHNVNLTDHTRQKIREVFVTNGKSAPFSAQS